MRLALIACCLIEFVRQRVNADRDSSQQSDKPPEQLHWCFACASPREHENPKMLAAMDQLLGLRYSKYPYDRVVQDCSRPGNFSRLIREKCEFPYCMQMTFDDGKGLPLTIRGCAESLVAINKAVIRSDCRQIHEKLDIRECVCDSSQRICGNNPPNSSPNGHRVFSGHYYLLALALPIAFTHYASLFNSLHPSRTIGASR